jgi:hypothetical protein
MISVQSHPILKGLEIIKRYAVEIDFRGEDGKINIKFIGRNIPENVANELEQMGWHLLNTGRNGSIYIHGC